jgi:N utilization substance protein A
MGRNAATILFSNLEFKLQRFIEDNLYKKYNDQVGDTISSVVTRVDSNDNTFIEIGEVKGILPRKNRIKGESFRVGDALKAVVRRVNIDKKHGLTIEVSRTSPKFLESLLKLEVPELKDGKVIIENSARIPGSRAKIALSTTEANIDPIGAVVGVKGVRINAVSEQLNGENIDCIEFTPIKEMYVSRALSPAVVKSVKIEAEAGENGKDKAIVTITADQKSKAIGKVGLNIRLASMLTQCDIELNVLEEGESAKVESGAVDTTEKKSTDISDLEALFK